MITVGFLTYIHMFNTINYLELTWIFNISLKKNQILKILRYMCKIGNLIEYHLFNKLNRFTFFIVGSNVIMQHGMCFSI